jgi:ankyrin repeat protein
MKLKSGIFILLLAGLVASAQTNKLTSLLQQGLFEEQANRNLDAAIADYQSLATQFDQNRPMAATAVFRLGECYRAQGKTNEAAAQYQRILRDFSDQVMLATLSRQNLAGMGALKNESTMATPPENSDVGLLKKLAGLQRGELEKILPTVLPDAALADLLQKRNEAEVKLAELKGDYLPENPVMVRQSTMLNELNRQIGERISGMLQGLKLRAELSEASPSSETARQQQKELLSVPAPNEEDQEIARIQTMIQNSPDLINAAQTGGTTPLNNAARSGQIKVATYLLDHGADINLASVGKDTPLLAAAGAGNRAMVELLLSRGADVNAKDNAGETALHQAAKHGFQAVTEVLLANHADVNAPSVGGTTPLCSAVQGGRVKIVQMLLGAGANVNYKQSDGNTVLNYALKTSPEIFKVLLDAGANPNTEDAEGRTPLSYAVERDTSEVVKLLLVAKADPNGGKLDAPLLAAIGAKDVTTAELLLQAGANPNTIGNQRVSVYFKGSMHLGNNHPSVSPLFLAVSLDQLPTVQLLLKYKADPNESQTDGQPLLFSALSHTNILEALLDAGAKVDPVSTLDDLQRTPLCVAANQNNAPAVEILLKHGANPNVCNQDGSTPLHWAAYQLADSKVFELLLANKADPNVRNRDGVTPLNRVKSRLADGDAKKKILAAQIADLLRQHGALDKLPDWDRITVNRPSANFSAAVFYKGTNGWNQFNLLEVLAQQYKLLQNSARGTWKTSYASIYDFWDKNPCRFPDLQRVIIHRPSPDGRQWTIQTVDVTKLLQTGDCSMDQPVQWGDVVEIPETDHPVDEQWDGLKPEDLDALLKCVTLRITIALKGTNSTLVFSPLCVKTNAVYFNVYGLNVTPVSYALRSVLDQSKLVRAASDLSRVKVSRQEPKTGKKREWILDCSGSNAPDLWLRNGDVIEVPEKP